MQYLKEFNVQKVWSQFANSTADLTSFLSKQNVYGLLNSEDWQIRLSFILFLFTLVNIVLIVLAWSIYGDTITNLVYNKPKSPARRLNNLHQNSDLNIEELIAKKIQ